MKNLETGKIEITSQNHSYAVDTDSLAHTPLQVTHVNLLDRKAPPALRTAPTSSTALST